MATIKKTIKEDLGVRGGSLTCHEIHEDYEQTTKIILSSPVEERDKAVTDWDEKDKAETDWDKKSKAQTNWRQTIEIQKDE